MEALIFIFILFFAAIIAIAANGSGETLDLKGFRTLSDELKLDLIDTDEFDRKLRFPELNGVYNGLGLTLQFENVNQQGSYTDFQILICIDLIGFLPFSYKLIPHHTIWDQKLDGYYQISTTDPKFEDATLLESTKDLLKQAHALFQEGSLVIEQSQLRFHLPTFLETEEEVEKVKQVLNVLMAVAQGFQEYGSSLNTQFPDFQKLNEHLGLQQTLEKQQLVSLIHQKANITPILCYQGTFKNYATRSYLYHKNHNMQLVVEFKLAKASEFSLAIFSDRKTNFLGLFKGQDIKTRDEDFDETFVVQSNDSLKAKQFLSHQDFRESFMKLDPLIVRWELSTQQISFQTTWESTTPKIVQNCFQSLKNALEIYEQL